MKRYLYMFFIFSIGILFCEINSIQAKKIQSLDQDQIVLEKDMNNPLTKKDSNTLSSKNDDNLHIFSSLEVKGKKKKESINFNHETMRINLNYIENR